MWAFARIALFLALSLKGADAEYKDVCIIGAGPAGIGAALALTDKGLGTSFVLLEREQAVGGQTLPAYTDPATALTLGGGAQTSVLTPADYPNVLSLARRVGLGIQPWQPGGVANVAYIPGPGAAPLPIAQTNATLRNGLLRAAVRAIPDLAATFRRYSAIYAQLKPTLMSVGGMPAIIAANLSLAQNLDSWLQMNDLMQLLPFFTETAMQTGYGHAFDSSAASFLQYLTPYTLAAVVGTFGIDTRSWISSADRGAYDAACYVLSNDVGFMEMLNRTAINLLPAGSVRTGVQITSLSRPPAGDASPVVISYTQNGVSRQTSCGRVIVTVAQALPNLQFMGLDSTETALFSKVIWCRYYTTAVVTTPPLKTGEYSLPLPIDSGTWRAVRSLRGGSFPNSPADPDASALVDPWCGQVNPGAANRPAGVPYNATPGLGVVYSYSDADVTPEAVSASAVAMLQGDGRHRNATARETLSFIYYPRVRIDDLRAGWFAKLDSMQGYRQTWHAGGLFTFWDVEGALRSGYNIVERFF